MTWTEDQQQAYVDTFVQALRESPRFSGWHVLQFPALEPGPPGRLAARLELMSPDFCRFFFRWNWKIDRFSMAFGSEFHACGVEACLKHCEDPEARARAQALKHPEGIVHHDTSAGAVTVTLPSYVEENGCIVLQNRGGGELTVTLAEPNEQDWKDLRLRMGESVHIEARTLDDGTSYWVETRTGEAHDVELLK